MIQIISINENLEHVLQKAKSNLILKEYTFLPSTDGRTSFDINYRNAHIVTPETEVLVIKKKIKELVKIYATNRLNIIYNDLYIEDHQVMWYGIGGGMPNHTDTYSESANKDLLRRKITSILYLNSDFEGGEIEFEQFNLKHKPKQNDLLIFSSDVLHKVYPITWGDRFSYRIFWGTR